MAPYSIYVYKAHLATNTYYSMGDTTETRHYTETLQKQDTAQTLQKQYTVCSGS